MYRAREVKETTRLRLFKKLPLLIAALIIFGVGWYSGGGNVSFLSTFKTENPELPDKLDYSEVDRAYNILKANYDGKLTEAQLIDGLKKGLIDAAGDPYTVYFNASDAKAFNESLEGSFEGIGAQLGKSGDNVVIISPLAGYPAAKAGLKAQDAIVKINGESSIGLSIEATVQKIRGPKDTKVTLTILRENVGTFDVTIMRDKIDIPSVTSSIKDGIGYMTISQFSDDTVGFAQEAAQNFVNNKIKAVVLDLRGNPGGYVNSAVGVASLWLNPGDKIVDERRNNVINSTEYASGDPILKGLPTVVLIDGGSASASEIAAGALSDHGVARLVGEKSYGKGSVQQVEKLNDGSQVKVTIARWYTPNGKNIDKEGITPEKVVKFSDSDIKNKVDSQMNAAVDLLKSMMK